jgi:hypothetical protein
MQTTADGIAAVFARLQDGYARLDPAALAALYAQECVVESQIAGRHVGRTAVEQTFWKIFSAFPISECIRTNCSYSAIALCGR